MPIRCRKIDINSITHKTFYLLLPLKKYDKIDILTKKKITRFVFTNKIVFFFSVAEKRRTVKSIPWNLQKTLKLTPLTV